MVTDRIRPLKINRFAVNGMDETMPTMGRKKVRLNRIAREMKVGGNAGL